MNSKNNYLLFGYIGYGNFGDELLLDNCLLNIPDNSSVTIFSAGTEEVVLRSGQRCRLKIRVIDRNFVKRIFAMITTSRVVCIGGTCFHGNKSGFFNIQLMAMAFKKKMEWKNVGFESTFNPNSRKQNTFHRTLYSISVRDNISAKIALNKFGVRPSIHEDVAFDRIYLENIIGSREFGALKRFQFVVSIKDSSIPYTTKLERIKQCIDGYCENEVVVMPACPKDNSICEKLANEIGIDILRLQWDMQLYVLSRTQVVIAERLHHQISAFSLDKETYCFAYMEKNKNAFENVQDKSRLYQL